MIKNKTPLVIIVILVIVIAVLAIIFGAPPTKEEGVEERPETKNMKNIADEIYGFTAEIEAINDRTLSLNGWVPEKGEVPSSARIIVKGVVTDETEIAKLIFPEGQEDKEKVYPEKTIIGLNSLEIGDTIHIVTKENISDNVKNNIAFDLESIFIIER